MALRRNGFAGLKETGVVGWLIKIRRDEEPQLKEENRVDCGKDSLAFDLMTLRTGHCRKPNLALDLVPRRDLSNEELYRTVRHQLPL